MLVVEVPVIIQYFIFNIIKVMFCLLKVLFHLVFFNDNTYKSYTLHATLKLLNADVETI